ncbi:hypothetical protein JR338_11520 [Chloroflexota bacterium]|nr:hypothetical protein JR338_11520 [Chloroflexota bacterium]
MKKTASLPDSLKVNNRQGHRFVPGVFLSQQRSILLIVGLLFALLTGWVCPVVRAQSAAAVVVHPPDLSTFPVIEFEFKALDANSQPLGGFGADQVQVIENGKALPVDALIEEYRGVHFTLAINGNREMDLRDDSGISRFEKLSAALSDWARSSSLKGDDAWSIVTNEGTQVDWTTTPRTWMNGLATYQPNFRLMEPDLASLQLAIQTMLDEHIDFGVNQTILYITPPPEPAQIESLNALTQQARNQGIRVDVWMVGDSYYLSNDQGGALVALAANTGGDFLQFDRLQGIPDLNGLHAALGRVESATYTSNIAESGTFTLGVSVDLGDLVVEGEGQPFTINVLAPNPMLLSPPILVERTWGTAGDTQTLEPDTQTIEILVQFPDGYPRALESSRLRVDGVVMDINTNEPFDSFKWDLGAYEESGEHFIQVEITDQLGLTAETISSPVEVRIVTPEIAPGFDWLKAGGIAAGVIAGAAVLLLIYWQVRQAVNSYKAAHPRAVTGSEDSQTPRPLPLLEKAPLAYFVPAQSLLGLEDPGVIPVTRPRFVLPDDLAVESPYLTEDKWTVERAWLNKLDNHFWLHSVGGNADVWLNAQQVGMESVEVKPGDLVYFGELGFRFTIKTDEDSRKASVEKYEPFL